MAARGAAQKGKPKKSAMTAAAAKKAAKKEEAVKDTKAAKSTKLARKSQGDGEDAKKVDAELTNAEAIRCHEGIKAGVAKSDEDFLDLAEKCYEMTANKWFKLPECGGHEHIQTYAVEEAGMPYPTFSMHATLVSKYRPLGIPRNEILGIGVSRARMLQTVIDAKNYKKWFGLAGKLTLGDLAVKVLEARGKLLPAPSPADKKAKTSKLVVDCVKEQHARIDKMIDVALEFVKKGEGELKGSERAAALDYICTTWGVNHLTADEELDNIVAFVEKNFDVTVTITAKKSNTKKAEAEPEKPAKAAKSSKPVKGKKGAKDNAARSDSSAEGTGGDSGKASSSASDEEFFGDEGKESAGAEAN